MTDAPKKSPWVMTFQKVKGGSDAFLGALKVGSFRFAPRRPDGSWPVVVSTMNGAVMFPNMSAALTAFHATLREPPPS